MGDSRIPTDEEIGKLIDLLYPILPYIVADLFGQKIEPIKLTKKERAEMIVKFRDAATRLQKVRHEGAIQRASNLNRAVAF